MSTNFAQFCDDIRQESNGKWILIGCYGHTMVVPGFPFAGKISCFLTLSVAKGTTSLKSVYSLASGAELALLEMDLIEAPDNDTEVAQVPLPPVPLHLSSADELILKVGLDNNDPMEVGRLIVALGQIPSSPEK